LLTKIESPWLDFAVDATHLRASTTAQVPRERAVASRKGNKNARIPELSRDDVEKIRARFGRLSPYDPNTKAVLLKLESENFDERGQPRNLECFAISAKRYVLFVRDAHGEPRIVKASEHGLGHLMDPTGNDDDRKAWMREAWLWILRRELGLTALAPTWFRLPVVSEMPVSSPETLRPFAELNRGRTFEDGVKPFNFVLAAHVSAIGHPSLADPERFQLIAPYERDPQKWLGLPWINRYGGKRYDLTTKVHTGGVGIACVQSYGEVISEFQGHRENKPCSGWLALRAGDARPPPAASRLCARRQIHR
jgi:hypothetical protein